MLSSFYYIYFTLTLVIFSITLYVYRRGVMIQRLIQHHDPRDDPEVERKAIAARDAALANMVTKVVTDQDDKLEPCTICLDQPEPGCEIVILPCFHSFHKACIELRGSLCNL